MFKTVIFAGLFAALAAPAFAEKGKTLREALDLEPGKYSLSELGVIFMTAPRDRKMRMMLIDRRNAEFRAKINDIVRDAGGDPVTATSGR